MTRLDFTRSVSLKTIAWLALPLAALGPLSLAQGAAQRVGLPQTIVAALAGMGEAQAATRAKPRKKVVRKKAQRPAAVKRTCTTTKVKGRRVTKCRTVKAVPAPLPVVMVPPVQPPTLGYAPPIAPLQVAPPPPVNRLPVVAPPPIPIAAYYYIDAADSFANALGKSPPDFSFDCGGYDCYGWVSRAGEVLIVEPGRDGVVQYYYAPGDTAPYLVRDSYNAYAFDGRALQVVYDQRGGVMIQPPVWEQVDYAVNLRERGRALYAGSLRSRRWDTGSAIAYGDWYDTFSYYPSWGYGWDRQWTQRVDYGLIPRHRQPRQLDDERRRRRHAEGDYQQWRRRGGDGAPPPTGNPVVTPVASPISPVGPGGSNGPGMGGGPRPRPPAPAPASTPTPPPLQPPVTQGPPQPPPPSVPPPVSQEPLPPASEPRVEPDPPEPGAPVRSRRPRREMQSDPGVEGSPPPAPAAVPVRPRFAPVPAPPPPLPPPPVQVYVAPPPPPAPAPER